jgi:NADH:ubiquinone oxidoreductase subunit 5 (subunit L)/multisubunit Na+/H+ antiporter MnhA subunit
MLLWSLVAVPLVAGSLLAVAGHRADRLAPAAGVGLAAVVVALAVAAALARPAVDAPLLAGIRAGLAVDGLSALLVVTVAGVALAVLGFAAGEPELRTARFVGLVLVFVAAMLATVTATTLPVLLMGWEVMGAMSWALIAYHWREPVAVRAAHTAFLTTRLADLGLYLAAGAALAGGVGSLALAELPGAATPWLHVVAAGVVVAALGKSAQLPFSFWLARAMEGPSPVSALLHSATMVAAGAYLLLRAGPLLGAAGWAGPAVAWIGVATALLLGLVAVAQRDLKQLLAASTAAQIGFMVLAAGVGATAAGALQLVAHAVTKSLLFLGAGAWLAALGTRDLGELRGAARRHPLVGATFTVGAAALAGLPPLSLWLAKDAVLAAALERSTALYVAGLAAAVVSAGYSAKAVWWVWQPVPVVGSVEDLPTGEGQVPAAMRVPLVLLAAFAAALGLLALPLALDAAPALWERVVSALLAVAAVAVALRAGDRLPEPRPLAGWLGLERAAHALLVRPVLALAHALARFDDRGLDRAVVAVPRGVRGSARALAAADDRGLDRAVRAVPRGVRALARGLAAADDRGLDAAVIGTARATRALATAVDRRGEFSVDGVVRLVAAGGRSLGRLARRPQTGQIHQYYAQAAAALAVLALLVVVVR